jgi:HAD superfamily hydrolase (TIGR01450 family)
LTEAFLTGVSVYYFDLDGCIYHGNKLASGVIPLLQHLDQLQLRYSFITNNSRQNAGEIAEKLNRLGLKVQPSRVICATDWIGKYVQEKLGIVSVKVVGSDSLRRAVAAFGHRILALEDKEAADVIVVGRDIEFSYAKLERIIEAVDSGSLVIGTNADLYHPGAAGVRVPETGALLASIQAITGSAITCVGKPEPYLFQQGMRNDGALPSVCVMVGDNLETDVIGSGRVGMKSIWVTNQAEAGTYAADSYALSKSNECRVGSIDGLYQMVLKTGHSENA